jgi:hypothetical protein
MQSSSKELKNIPVSISILHDQEYNNLYLMLNLKKNKVRRRRAFSDKSNDRFSDTSDDLNQFKPYIHRRKTLKN